MGSNPFKKSHSLFDIKSPTALSQDISPKTRIISRENPAGYLCQYKK
jgi:hypothetical protein